MMLNKITPENDLISLETFSGVKLYFMTSDCFDITDLRQPSGNTDTLSDASGDVRNGFQRKIIKLVVLIDCVNIQIVFHFFV